MKILKPLIVSAVTIAAVTGLSAQKSPIDFETSGNGASFTWTTFENGANPSVEIVANPSSSGLNVSATVAKFTAMNAGQPWAGFESKHGSDIGTFTLSASNCIVKLHVWKSVKSDIGIKFASASSASSGEIKVANTTTGAWEELVFDFSARIGETNDQIIIFPDFAVTPARGSDNVCYVDNIRFEGKGAGAGNRVNVEPVVILYPNPSNKTVTLNCETMMDEIAIYSTSGKLIKTLYNVKPNPSIDISDLAAGIYHISIKTAATVNGVQLVVQ
jgi:hypothetical protein